MERISLARKIQYCLKYGTLKTYSYLEARDRFKEYYSEESLDELKEAYLAGKFISGFTSNNDLDENIFQVGFSFSTFIIEVVYPILLMNHEEDK
jgi:predicted nucleic acid-binding protein